MSSLDCTNYWSPLDLGPDHQPTRPQCRDELNGAYRLCWVTERERERASAWKCKLKEMLRTKDGGEEREMQKEAERDRKRQRETERQREAERKRERPRETERKSKRQRETETGREKQSETERGRERNC